MDTYATEQDSSTYPARAGGDPFCSRKKASVSRTPGEPSSSVCVGEMGDNMDVTSGDSEGGWRDIMVEVRKTSSWSRW